MTPAFSTPIYTLVAGDRFHAIQVSDGIRYETDSTVKTIITFFVVRRASGLFDIVTTVVTFRGRRCVSSKAHSKPGIDYDRIESEIAAIETVFSKAIEVITGYRIKWHRLDLARTEDRATQIACIQHWGRARVRVGIDGRIALN
jgi:hypothetical protein